MKLLDNLDFLDNSPQNSLNIKMLKSMMEDKMPHAFLFWGSSDDRLYRLALAFAASINCSQGGCGSCPVCRTTQKGIYCNLMIVEADGNIITVDKVKQVQDYCSLTSYDQKKKIVVVKEAESLNEEASNKFLKTLEDPPGPDCVFILLTGQPGLLLETIQSRCLQFEWSFKDEDSRDIKMEGLEEWLQVQIKKIIAGDKASMLGLGKEVVETLEEEAQKIKKEMVSRAEDDSGQVDQNLIKRKMARFNRLGIEKVFDIIIAWLEDIVAVRMGAGSKALNYSSNYRFLDSTIMGTKVDRILEILENIEENRYYLNRSINCELVLDSIFLNLDQVIRGENE